MEEFQRGRERSAERDRGTAVAGGLRFSSGRAADQLIQSPARLPTVRTTTPIQDSLGRFLYIEGYSDPAGPDIGAPG